MRNKRRCPGGTPLKNRLVACLISAALLVSSGVQTVFAALPEASADPPAASTESSQPEVPIPEPSQPPESTESTETPSTGTGSEESAPASEAESTLTPPLSAPESSTEHSAAESGTESAATSIGESSLESSTAESATESSAVESKPEEALPTKHYGDYYASTMFAGNLNLLTAHEHWFASKDNTMGGAGTEPILESENTITYQSSSPEWKASLGTYRLSYKITPKDTAKKEYAATVDVHVLSDRKGRSLAQAGDKFNLGSSSGSSDSTRVGYDGTSLWRIDDINAFAFCGDSMKTAPGYAGFDSKGNWNITGSNRIKRALVYADWNGKMQMSKKVTSAGAITSGVSTTWLYAIDALVSYYKNYDSGPLTPTDATADKVVAKYTHDSGSGMRNAIKQMIEFAEDNSDSIIVAAYDLISFKTKEYSSAQNSSSAQELFSLIRTADPALDGGLKIVKTSEDDNVSGITFTITGSGYSKTATTNGSGVINLTDLTPGTYTVKETVPSYYEPQSSKSVTVVANSTATVSFANVLKRGKVTVKKTASDGFVSAKTFRLAGKAANGSTVNLTAKTNASGIATFNNVLISNAKGYTLTEVGTEDRYVIPPAQNADVAFNDVLNLSVQNIIKKFQVKISKEDAETGAIVQGDATLEGAEFDLLCNGVPQGKPLVIKNGTAISPEYECEDGTNAVWTLKEASAPEGYLLNETTWTIPSDVNEYTAETTIVPITVKENVIKGKIQINKYRDYSGVWDNGTTGNTESESGAQFEVYLKKSGSYAAAADYNRDLITTNGSGTAITKDLPYGTYVVHQVSGAAGHHYVSDFEVTISEQGKTYSYTKYNEVYSSSLKIVKQDVETGRVVPLANTSFQVYDYGAGKLVNMGGNNTFYTDSTGSVTLPEKLRYGSYEVREIRAPEGYAISPNPYSFVVNGSSNTITVQVRNAPQKGKISVKKQGRSFTGTKEVDTPYGLQTQIIYSTLGLAGATYTITAAEDIITPDGTVRANRGQVVQTLTTDSKGGASSATLYLGKYTIKEINAPDGYLLDAPDQEVALTYQGQNIVIQETTETSWFNQRQRLKANLKKTMEQDEQYHVGMNEEYKNVVFGLFTGDTIKAEGSKLTIAPDAMLAYSGIDENGVFEYLDELPFGKYYLKEVATDEQYLTKPQSYPFEFKYQGSGIPTVVVNPNNGDTVENVIKRGDIETTKVDLEYPDNKLSGAEFEVYKDINKDGTYTPDVDKMVVKLTENAGVYSAQDLPYGQYFLYEKTPPEGFLQDTTYHPFFIEDGKKTIVETQAGVGFINEPIKAKIELEKLEDHREVYDNGTTAPIEPEEGAQFEVYLKKAGSYAATPEPDRDLLTIGKDGKAITKDLRYGVYIVHQIKGTEGYHFMEDIEVNIKDHGNVYQYTRHDLVMSSEIKIVKQDVETGKIIPVANTGFHIFDFAANALVKVNGSEIINTDATGMITLPEKLRYGKYELREVKAPDGYTINPDPHPFTVDETEAPITITVSNLAQKGKIQVGKNGEVFFDIEVPTPESEHGPQQLPMYEVRGLPGAEYTVTAVTDIITADGTLRAKAGEVVSKLVTDATGKATTDLLYLGKYVIKEVKAPDGYLLDAPEQTVDLIYCGQEFVVQDPTVISFYNARQTIQLELEKLLEQDENYRVGMNGEYKNVIFGVFPAEDIPTIDGDKKLEANKLITFAGIDEKGIWNMHLKLPFGQYYVKEIKTDDQYILSNETYPFEFTYQGQEVATVNIRPSGTPIENKIKRGKALTTKVDIDRPSDELAGVTFAVYKDMDESGSYTKRDLRVGVLKEITKGNYEIEKLPFGHYLLKEEVPPTGFEVDEKYHPFKVESDGHAVRIENTKGVGFADASKVGKVAFRITDPKMSTPGSTVGSGWTGRGTTTGDDTRLWLLILLSLVSLGGIVGSKLYQRRKQRLATEEQQQQ